MDSTFSSKVGLRSPLSSFVGRTTEIAELSRLLVRRRLLTLTGSGGSGKTRLALELAERRERRQPDGVRTVDLTAIRDDETVSIEVARALRLPADDALHAVDLLSADLGGRRMLLVLDNCEHLVDRSAHLADTLLARCPRLQILVTSRETLGLPYETVYPVPPLALDEAVRLFVARAQDRRADLSLADRRAIVAEICRRLDALPLAIELAAGRIAMMRPEEILAQLQGRRFGLLAGVGRGGQDRHRTLRATVGWSYDLLSDDERWLFRRLAVFAGSFDLEVVERLRSGAVDLLARLIDKSMVVPVSSARTTRYVLLETIREYALERLHEAGEEGEARRAHLGLFLERAQVAFAARLATGSGTLLGVLAVELENIRGALEWSREHDPCAGLRLIGATRELWYRLSQREGLSRATEFVGLCPDRDRDRAWGLLAIAYLANTQRQFAEARQAADEANVIARKLADPAIQSWAAYHLGLTGFLSMDLDAALDWLPRSAQLFEAAGDRLGQGMALASLGTVYFLRRDWALAGSTLAAGLELLEGVADEWGQGLCHTYLGFVARERRDEVAASGHVERAVQLLGPIGDVTMLTMALVGRAQVIAHRDPARATRLAGGAVGLRQRLGGPLLPFAQAAVEHIRADAARSLGVDVAEGLWEAGTNLSRDACIALALDAPIDRHVRIGPLSPRELDVARLVAGGLGDQGVAARLGLSRRTVENHLLHIRNKIGAENRTQVAAWLLERERAPAE